eukprot:4829893-Amphidinium_carterae.1
MAPAGCRIASNNELPQARSSRLMSERSEPTYAQQGGRRMSNLGQLGSRQGSKAKLLLLEAHGVTQD